MVIIKRYNINCQVNDITVKRDPVERNGHGFKLIDTAERYDSDIQYKIKALPIKNFI